MPDPLPTRESLPYLTSQPMRRILFIAYAYPPCGGAGVQRSAKFVRYLPEHGWLPTVLTVAPSCYGLHDNSQVRDVPAGVDVVRTLHFDPVAALSRPRQCSQNLNGHGTSGP